MRLGVDPLTGNWLTGWEHCVACLSMLFMTRIGSVPWRRLYGAGIKDLQDQNAAPVTILEFYTSVAEAVDKFEPGLALPMPRRWQPFGNSRPMPCAGPEPSSTRWSPMPTKPLMMPPPLKQSRP